jgi:hypothetical protein
MPRKSFLSSALTLLPTYVQFAGGAECQLQPADEAAGHAGLRAPRPPPAVRQLQQAHLPALLHLPHDGAAGAGCAPQLPPRAPRRAREPRKPRDAQREPELPVPAGAALRHRPPRLAPGAGHQLQLHLRAAGLHGLPHQARQVQRHGQPAGVPAHGRGGAEPRRHAHLPQRPDQQRREQQEEEAVVDAQEAGQVQHVLSGDDDARPLQGAREHRGPPHVGLPVAQRHRIAGVPQHAVAPKAFLAAEELGPNIRC